MLYSIVHVIFTIERGRSRNAFNAVIRSHNFVEEMMSSEGNWSAINATVAAVQKNPLQVDLPRKARRTRDFANQYFTVILWGYGDLFRRESQISC